MKKLIIAFLITLGSFSIVSAEIGVNIGVSGSLGEYTATGSENENGEISAKRSEKALGGIASYFIEKELSFLPWGLGRITVGYDKAAHKISTASITTNRTESEKTPAANLVVTQNVSADIENITTTYATFRIFDWMYVKSGSMSMDVKTTEGLETGSSYPDASLDGTVIGFGFHKETDDGFFLRAEWTETEIDGVTLTSSTNTDNTVTLDEVTGEQYRLSVGKAF
tara:strand:+ start:1112 stop:1786 length:675 start_codon:yes stop_codon:yes gene_type:complete